MNARRSPRVAPAAAAAALALTTACFRGPTTGELGNAMFSYDEGAFGCLVGCPSASEPMAAGSRVHINVTNAGDLADFSVSTANESVATFTRIGTATVKGKLWIVVGASSFAAGDTRLALTDTASGAEIDRLPLRVRDVQKIEVRDRAEKYRDRLTIMTGGSTTLRMTLRDSSGAELVGHGGLDYTYQGAAGSPEPLQVLFGELIASIFIGTVPENMEIEANSVPGSGTIVASSPAGASLEIPVQVIDESAVTSLQLEGSEGGAEVGDTYFVEAHAMAGAEQVHSPKCLWALSEVVGPVTIDSAGRDSASLESTEPGSATLTCAMGQMSSALHVTFK